MKEMMSYKGYYGSAYYNDEDNVFHGKIEFISSLVTYEGTDVKNLRKAFKEAVDAYLKLYMEEGINLNTVVINALEKYLSKAIVFNQHWIEQGRVHMAFYLIRKFIFRHLCPDF